MTELDQLWSQMLDSAATRAESSGRSEIANYLRLKAANDAIRSRGVQWLFDSMIEIADAARHDGRSINIEREEPHSFQVGNSKMVGAALQLRLGVRCMTVEAGWTRTPSDGIMRGGALAAARIRHFGMKNGVADMVLAYADSLPLWHFQDINGRLETAQTQDLVRHFRKLMET